MASSHRRPTPSRYPSSRGSYRILLVCLVAAVAGGYGVVRLTLPPPASHPLSAAQGTVPAAGGSVAPSGVAPATTRPANPATPPGSAQPRASPASDESGSAAQPVVERRWLTVLERLDRIRERAWKLGRVGLLRRVWTRTSSGLDTDRRMLRAWSGRGFRVVGVSMTFERVRVLRHQTGTVVLRCVDWLGPVVAAPGSRLPTDRPTRHRITLVRTAEGWRLSQVRRLG